MTIEAKSRDEKLQYNNNREAAKISALSSAKIDKYKYLTDEEKFRSNRRQIIKQSRIKNLGKPLDKPTEKQLDALKSVSLSNKIDELKIVKNC